MVIPREIRFSEVDGAVGLHNSHTLAHSCISTSKPHSSHRSGKAFHVARLLPLSSLAQLLTIKSVRTLLYLEELGNNDFNRESYVTVTVNSRNETDSNASSIGTL